MPSPVVLFDGECVLCNRGVRFILAREREATLRFAALQSSGARAALGLSGDEPVPLDSLIYVCTDGAPLARSDAVVSISRHLRAPWRWGGAMLGVLPRGVRDRLYRFVAARRYRWFGKLDECPVPDDRLRARML